MNVIAWLMHLALLVWCWPLIRFWWSGDASLEWQGGDTYGKPPVPHGRRRWAVVASLLLPIVSWCWLVPVRVSHGWRVAELESIRLRHQQTAERNRDIAFWREQAATGDLLAATVAVELLDMWGVPPAERRHRAPALEVDESTWQLYAARPRALPGAHPYSGRCPCRNCGRVRRSSP